MPKKMKEECYVKRSWFFALLNFLMKLPPLFFSLFLRREGGKLGERLFTMNEH